MREMNMARIASHVLACDLVDPTDQKRPTHFCHRILLKGRVDVGRRVASVRANAGFRPQQTRLTSEDTALRPQPTRCGSGGPDEPSLACISFLPTMQMVLGSGIS